jgi:DNA-binding MarR family transcriptional regulator
LAVAWLLFMTTPELTCQYGLLIELTCQIIPREDAHMPNLNHREQHLWRGFLRWSELIRAQVASELTSASGLSVGEFEILVRLGEAGGALDQRELGESMTWTASRLSHQLNRMEGRGLVRRQPTGVGRSMKVALRADGGRALSSALAIHASAVRRHFLEPLTQPDADALGRIVDGVAPEPTSRPEQEPAVGTAREGTAMPTAD